MSEEREFKKQDSMDDDEGVRNVVDPNSHLACESRVLPQYVPKPVTTRSQSRLIGEVLEIVPQLGLTNSASHCRGQAKSVENTPTCAPRTSPEEGSVTLHRHDTKKRPEPTHHAGKAGIGHRTGAQHKKLPGPQHRTGKDRHAVGTEEVRAWVELETRRHDCARHMCMCCALCVVVHVSRARAVLHCAARRYASRATLFTYLLG